MRLPLFFTAALTLAAALLAPADALAVCKGGAPDGLCEPPDDDCACDDCLAACSGECTPSDPPACTLEDSCTCSECWTDEFCTDPTKDNCKNDGTCEFFAEGCCCADCAALDNCAGFDGTCDAGTGGSGGSGTGGSSSTGGAGTGGSSTTGGNAGSGTGGATVPQPGGCGCVAAGASSDDGASFPLSSAPFAFASAALGAVALLRRRRRCPGAR